MATSKEYLAFVLDCLRDCPEVSTRAMMGEYLIYYRDKVVGGVYDNRFLVKSVPAAVARMPETEYQLPYEGGKEMLLVDRLEEPAFLRELLEAMYPELPATKKRKK